jgi:hypothetical protein
MSNINFTLIIIVFLFILYYFYEIFIKDKLFENMNNCYSYAFDRMGNYKKKPQPGKFSNIRKVIGKKNYKCSAFVKRVLADNKNARFVSIKDYKSNGKCNNDENTVFLAVDNTGVSIDYHFYKKEPNDIYWTHKPGNSHVRNFDSDGKKILNPLIANRDYEKKDINNEHKWNYSKPCGFFCYK